MAKLLPENLTISEVGHLPINQRLCKKDQTGRNPGQHGRQSNGAFTRNNRISHGIGYTFRKNTALPA